ncbi:MAG: branched-chain amino acid ABC transporter permease, partial [Candidatus Bathyarchaeia archaeon]
ALLAASYGAFCGAFLFRFGLGGHYLVIATIALSEIVRVIFINWADMGGAWGLLMPVVPDSWYDFQFHVNRLPYYYIALAMLLSIILIELKIVRSRLGYYFVAIKDDEAMAESLGINTFKYKLLAMIISAGLTGFAGTFYAQYVLYIAPDTVMPVGMSTEILIGPVVGGMGTIAGPIIGAAIIQPIHEFTRAYVIAYTKRAGLDYVVAGVLMVLVAILRPRGVVEWFDKAYAKILSALPYPTEGSE